MVLIAENSHIDTTKNGALEKAMSQRPLNYHNFEVSILNFAGVLVRD